MGRKERNTTRVSYSVFSLSYQAGLDQSVTKGPRDPSISDHPPKGYNSNHQRTRLISAAPHGTYFCVLCQRKASKARMMVMMIEQDLFPDHASSALTCISLTGAPCCGGLSSSGKDSAKKWRVRACGWRLAYILHVWTIIVIMYPVEACLVHPRVHALAPRGM